MVRDRASQMVKFFTADNATDLEANVNGFLNDIRSENVIDIKYAVDMPEPGVLLHTAMVIYQIYLNPRQE